MKSMACLAGLLAATLLTPTQLHAQWSVVWSVESLDLFRATESIGGPKNLTDLDGDGQKEIILQQATGSPNVAVFRIVDATTGYIEYESTRPTSSVSYNDVDGDGRTELFLRYNSQFVDMISFIGPVGTPEQPPAIGLKAIAAPNPSDGQVSFTIETTSASPVMTRIFDVSGRLLRELEIPAPIVGVNEVKWDGRDNQGGRVASGVYFYEASQLGSTTGGRNIVIVR